MVAAALLLPTAFSLAYVVNQQRHVRDLDLVRRAMTEMLNRDGKQSQSPASILPVSNVTPQVATQPVPAPQVRPAAPLGVRPQR